MRFADFLSPAAKHSGASEVEQGVVSFFVYVFRSVCSRSNNHRVCFPSLQTDPSQRSATFYMPPKANKLNLLNPDEAWDKNRQVRWLAEDKNNPRFPLCGAFVDHIDLEAEFNAVSQSLAVDSDFFFSVAGEESAAPSPRLELHPNGLELG